jgi:hypothetical protein
MRHMRRIALVVSTAGLLLAGLGLAPAAVPAMAASGITIQTYSASAYQYTKYCDGSTCNLEESTILDFEFIENGEVPVTIDWKTQDVTAHNGVDYTGPTSGSVSIPQNDCANCAFVEFAVVNTGTPGTKTFNFLVTGTSVPATTDNGTGTIYPGAQIPNDCSLAYVSSKSKSLTCTGRPSGQEWDFDLLCPDAPSFFRNAMGNEVTGDGTSTATCIDGTAYDTGDFET